MAQWIQTLEPYIKVIETVRETALNPVAGEDLIIGCVLISDAGPATPTLIASQSEFLATYSSKDVTQDYLKSLNKLYSGDDTTLASTMWANAYRLAGSNTLLITRASKAKDLYFSKPLGVNDQNTYLLRDGELMKYIDGGFRLVIDSTLSEVDHEGDGWLINISGVGLFGNRTTDEGAQYDYYVDNLVDLVSKMNETNKFFSPSYVFLNENNEPIDGLNEDSKLEDKKSAIAVKFEEVYLGQLILDTSDPRCADGLAYLLATTANSEATSSDSSVPANEIIDLNGTAFSDFEASPYYAINRYNSSTVLRVRIRRFNHDAVVSKELTDTKVASLTASGESPYVVLTDVLDTFTSGGTKEPSASQKARDFFEVAVWDPSINSEVSFFNIGNIIGRGDIEASELNSLLQMIQVNLPDDMHDLGLNYYGYPEDDNIYSPTDSTLLKCNWEEVSSDTVDVTVEVLPEYVPETQANKIYQVTGNSQKYKCVLALNGENQLYADLTIDSDEYSILSVSDTDLKKALDEIAQDEVYTTEGLCDLGNTKLSFQNYMANMAINENYFYPISTTNSTNYMTIANSASKIPLVSHKLYMLAPWDVDSGNLGWKFYASPGVLYWEAVARNRRNNMEFNGVLGQTYGIAQYQRPVTEFNKKTRQLLLSKKINTVKWDVTTQRWNINDNVTKAASNNIVNDDGNVRLAIRIEKAMPTLLRQFIGRKINQKLCDDMYSVIDYFFKTVILPMGVTVDAYQIFVPYIEENARNNKQQVTVNVRFFRTLKYVTVYTDLFDAGMDVSTDAHNLTGQG